MIANAGQFGLAFRAVTEYFARGCHGRSVYAADAPAIFAGLSRKISQDPASCGIPSESVRDAQSAQLRTSAKPISWMVCNAAGGSSNRAGSEGARFVASALNLMQPDDVQSGGAQLRQPLLHNSTGLVCRIVQCVDRQQIARVVDISDRAQQSRRRTVRCLWAVGSSPLARTDSRCRSGPVGGRTFPSQKHKIQLPQ